MKLVSKIVAFAILLSVVCLTTTCKKRLFKKISYQGTVFDHRTNGVPVAGVKITLKACGGGSSDAAFYCSGSQFVIGEATTDASGHFSINEKAASSDVYFVWFSNTEYNPGDGVSSKELNTRFSSVFLAP